MAAPEERMRTLPDTEDNLHQLRSAWRMCGSWKVNSSNFKSFSIPLWVLQSLATWFVVVLTAIESMNARSKLEATDLSDQQARDDINQSMNQSMPLSIRDDIFYLKTSNYWTGVMIVILPIIAMLLLQVIKIWNPKKKWAAYSSADSTLMSEIYKYRARVDGYGDPQTRVRVFQGRQKEICDKLNEELDDSMDGSMDDPAMELHAAGWIKSDTGMGKGDLFHYRFSNEIPQKPLSTGCSAGVVVLVSLIVLASVVLVFLVIALVLAAPDDWKATSTKWKGVEEVFVQVVLKPEVSWPLLAILVLMLCIILLRRLRAKPGPQPQQRVEPVDDGFSMLRLSDYMSMHGSFLQARANLFAKSQAMLHNGLLIGTVLLSSIISMISGLATESGKIWVPTLSAFSIILSDFITWHATGENLHAFVSSAHRIRQESANYNAWKDSSRQNEEQEAEMIITNTERSYLTGVLAFAKNMMASGMKDEAKAEATEGNATTSKQDDNAQSTATEEKNIALGQNEKVNGEATEYPTTVSHHDTSKKIVSSIEYITSNALTRTIAKYGVVSDEDVNKASSFHDVENQHMEVDESATKLLLRKSPEQRALWKAWAFAGSLRMETQSQKLRANLCWWAIHILMLVTALAAVFEEKAQIMKKRAGAKQEDEDFDYWTACIEWTTAIMVISPALTTLIIALNSKFEPKVKWSVFDEGCSSTLRAIYMFRARAGIYSDQALKKSFDSSNIQTLWDQKMHSNRLRCLCLSITLDVVEDTIRKALPDYALSRHGDQPGFEYIRKVMLNYASNLQVKFDEEHWPSPEKQKPLVSYAEAALLIFVPVMLFLYLHFAGHRIPYVSALCRAEVWGPSVLFLGLAAALAALKWRQGHLQSQSRPPPIDDGFKDLSPSAYLRYRLSPLTLRAANLASSLSALNVSFTIVGIAIAGLISILGMFPSVGLSRWLPGIVMFRSILSAFLEWHATSLQALTWSKAKQRLEKMERFFIAQCDTCENDLYDDIVNEAEDAFFDAAVQFNQRLKERGMVAIKTADKDSKQSEKMRRGSE